MSKKTADVNMKCPLSGRHGHTILTSAAFIHILPKKSFVIYFCSFVSFRNINTTAAMSPPSNGAAINTHTCASGV